MSYEICENLVDWLANTKYKYVVIRRGDEMMHYKALSLLVMLLVSTQSLAEVTKVLIVRHAEKADEQGASNPGLSDMGQDRALVLEQIAMQENAVAVFASEYQRTIQTVQPIAATLDQAVNIVSARYPQQLAQKILTEFRGKTVVVAGHSNTVPWIISALGGPAIDPIADEEFDKLYYLLIDDTVVLEEVEYGQVSP